MLDVLFRSFVSVPLAVHTEGISSRSLFHGLRHQCSTLVLLGKQLCPCLGSTQLLSGSKEALLGQTSSVLSRSAMALRGAGFLQGNHLSPEGKKATSGCRESTPSHQDPHTVAPTGLLTPTSWTRAIVALQTMTVVSRGLDQHPNLVVTLRDHLTLSIYSLLIGG